MAEATLVAMPDTLGETRRRGTKRLGTTVAEVGRIFKNLFDPYRPELHYMRGPGPKWHAKHGRSASAGR